VAPVRVRARVRESARRARRPKLLRARLSALARTHAPTSARSLVPTRRHRLAVAACASSLPLPPPRPPLRPSLPAPVFASTSRSFVMAVDTPAGSSPPADGVPRTNQDGRAAGGSSSAPARVVGGSSGSGASGSGAAEGLVQVKSSSTTFFPLVRVGVVKLWHDTVNERARRHQSRGVSKRLHVAFISAHPVNTNKWVRRLCVDGKPMGKAAVSRLITKAVALFNVTNTIKMHNTGRAADYVEGRVKKRVGEQGKAWRMSYEEANKTLKLVTDTQPLVGGVQCVAQPFGGSPPDDGPAGTPSGSGQHGETGEAEEGADGTNGDGRSDGRGGGASSAAGAGWSASAPGPVDDMLGNPPGVNDLDDELAEDEAGGSEADDADNGGMDDGASGVSDGSGGTAPGPRPANPGGAPRMQASPVSATALNRGSASGRSRRAAVADAAVEAMVPGGGELMRRLAESLSHGVRCFDEKKTTKWMATMESEHTKRVAMLTAAVEKHPENETSREMLNIAMGEPTGSSDPTL